MKPSKTPHLTNSSEIGIPCVLMRIISRHGFPKGQHQAFILTCQIKPVSYYPSKRSGIVQHGSEAYNNVPFEGNEQTNAIDNHKHDFVLTWNIETFSIVNTLKSGYINFPFLLNIPQFLWWSQKNPQMNYQCIYINPYRSSWAHINFLLWTGTKTWFVVISAQYFKKSENYQKRRI